MDFEMDLATGCSQKGHGPQRVGCRVQWSIRGREDIEDGLGCIVGDCRTRGGKHKTINSMSRVTADSQ